MKACFSDKAREELDGMNREMAVLFIRHAEKLESMPARRHMRFGLPHYVEEVTKQARMIYDIQGEDLFVLHCFKTHKEYERWYKSYK